MTIEWIKKRIKHNIERHQQREIELMHKRDNLSKAGEWSLGYEDGYLNAMDTILGYLEEL